MTGRSFAAALSLCVALSAVARAPRSAIEARIDRMSLRERLGQLLCVGLTSTTVGDEARRLVAEARVGAVVLYAQNVQSPEQLRALTSGLRELAGNGVPPFIAIDQEGGEVTRVFTGAAVFPGSMALGSTRSAELAERAGAITGSDLRALGVTMNFAPVLDVASNPRSAINIRSFGSDPALVASLGAAFVRGQAASGIVTVVKHFPGIGGAEADSHRELPVLSPDDARAHLSPFRAAIAAGADGVMVGHVVAPSLDPKSAATLSPAVIGLLRRELAFDGIVITDALQMRALDRSAGIGNLAVRSILAGADMVMVLWQRTDREDVLAALEAAHARGELTDERIRASLRRILRVKERRGPAKATAQPSRSAIADEIARRAVTLLRNRGAIIPVRRDAAEKALYIGPVGAIAETIATPNALHPPARLTETTITTWSQRAILMARKATMIVAAAQNGNQMKIVAAARRANPSAPLILISLGSPDLVRDVPDADAYLCAYGFLDVSQRAVARVLRGDGEPRGRLPVAVPGVFAVGDPKP